MLVMLLNMLYTKSSRLYCTHCEKLGQSTLNSVLLWRVLTLSKHLLASGRALILYRFGKGWNITKETHNCSRELACQREGGYKGLQGWPSAQDSG
jgi:hypothetical protein